MSHGARAESLLFFEMSKIESAVLGNASEAFEHETEEAFEEN